MLISFHPCFDAKPVVTKVRTLFGGSFRAGLLTCDHTIDHFTVARQFVICTRFPILSVIGRAPGTRTSRRRYRLYQQCNRKLINRRSAVPFQDQSKAGLPAFDNESGSDQEILLRLWVNGCNCDSLRYPDSNQVILYYGRNVCLSS